MMRKDLDLFINDEEVANLKARKDLRLKKRRMKMVGLNIVSRHEI